VIERNLQYFSIRIGKKFENKIYKHEFCAKTQKGMVIITKIAIKSALLYTARRIFRSSCLLADNMNFERLECYGIFFAIRQFRAGLLFYLTVINKYKLAACRVICTFR